MVGGVSGSIKAVYFIRNTPVARGGRLGLGFLLNVIIHHTCLNCC